MPDGDGAIPQSPLTAWVAAGESGPVIVLSGEADLTCAGQLSALITAQLAGGTRQLTIDVSELRFADSASIRTLALAARTRRVRLPVTALCVTSVTVTLWLPAFLRVTGKV